MTGWGIAGLVAGCVAFLAARGRWIVDLAVLDVPLVVALPYVVVLGAWMCLRGARVSPSMCLWGLGVVVAWVVAARAAAATVSDASMRFPSRTTLLVAGVVGGFVGSGGIALANLVLLPATQSARGFAAVMCAGTACGVLFAVSDSVAPILIGWQGAVAGATGFVVEGRFAARPMPVRPRPGAPTAGRAPAAAPPRGRPPRAGGRRPGNGT